MPRSLDQQQTSRLQPPEGLFLRIITRLGLEKELAVVKQHIEFFGALAVTFLVLFVFALVGIQHVLAESAFLPFLSLLFSDPGVIIRDFHSFAFSIFESLPSISFSFALFALAFLMLCARLLVFAFDRFTLVVKSINRQKHGHI